MRTTILATLLLLLCTSCWGSRRLSDPTLLVRGETGQELGVSTDYGVVFLGHAVQSGYVEVTAWFGDGPSIESSVVEPIGGGLYTAETEIRLPYVPISFEPPYPGQEVQVIGRDSQSRWTGVAIVREDPAVLGFLLEPSPELFLDDSQVGAGVFIGEEGHEQLLGLVSGRIRITDEESGQREYLTVVGAEELWRLVTHRTDQGARRPFVYRQDIL